jgi:hypothetical protein
MPAMDQTWNLTSNATIDASTTDACNSYILGMAIAIAAVLGLAGASTIFGLLLGFRLLGAIDNEYAEEEWERRGVPNIDRKAYREYLKKRTPTIRSIVKEWFIWVKPQEGRSGWLPTPRRP